MRLAFKIVAEDRSEMKVALTIWEDRISPLFDAAREMLVVDIADSRIISRRHEPISPQWPLRFADRLADQGVGVLICGAISQLPAGTIEAAGIQLVPFVAGNVDDVLAVLASGAPIIPIFSMPGCGTRYCRRVGEGNKACGKRMSAGRKLSPGHERGNRGNK